MSNERFVKSFVCIIAIQWVVAYPFPEFQFAYKILSHNSIELQTVYNGFQIESIRFYESDNFEPISDYFSNRANHIIIQGLESCTTHQISAVVYNFQFNVQFLHKKNITTVDTELPIKIQSVVSTSNAIYIELNITRIRCIDNLYVVLDKTVRLFYTQANITKQLIISELEPCTYYHTEIIFNYQSNSNLNIIHEQYIKTLPNVLKPPQNIKFDSQTNLVTWGPIVSANCPTKFIITIEPYNTSNQSTLFTAESVMAKYDLGFLAKCLQFQITIHPEGRDDLSRTILIETPYQEPGPITNITVDVSTNTNMLSIKWDRPKENPKCIKHFVIKVNDVLAATTNTLEHIAYEIIPSEVSNISVCVMGQISTVEKCTSSTFHFAQMQTIEIKNVSEINVQSDAGTKFTTITWDEPNGAKGGIRHYEVNLRDSSGPVGHDIFTLSNKIEIPILVACESYVLCIKTIPVIKRPSIISSTFKFKGPPQKPNPPAVLQLLSKTSNSLTMKSSYSTQNDKCGIEMFRFVCARGAELRFVDEENGIAVMSNLKSHTVYACSVMVKNEMDWSESCEIKKFLTDGAKSAFDLYAHLVSSNSIGVSWSRRYISINLTITKMENTGLVPLCKYVDYNYAVTLERRRRKHKFNNLEPYTNYTIHAAAYGLAENFTKEILVTTQPDVPHQVRHLRIINSTSHSVTISWRLPCILNGRVKGFVIKTQQPRSESFLPFDETTIAKSFYYTANHITTVGPSTNISVSIKLFNLVGALNESTITLANTPISDWLDDWVEISMDESEHVLLNIKNENFMLANDSVTGFTLVISDTECDNLETDDVFLLLLAKDDCIQQCNFSVIPNTVKITFIEGKSRVCSNPSELELMRGPDYAILARVFTSKGFTDTFPIVFKSNQILQSSSSSFIMIFLILLVCLVFIIMSVTTIVWYYKNRNPQNVRRINNYIEVQFFPDFYKLINQSFIANEYKSINDMNLSNLTKTIAQNYPDKNRYMDITPYDYNRVILTPNEYCTTDYINASYIDGEKQEAQYIATQGPKEETVYDFWHMVIEKNCDKIVMMTQLNENNLDKCYKYYPNENETLVFGDIVITNADETNVGTFIRRRLIVERDKSNLLVVHYQFLAWPDFECPRNELAVIEFIEIVKNEKIMSTDPMVVHCSAGVGRTGTYIALDILLQSFHNDKYINIFDTVRKLRVQRCLMVQTVGQYEFLYALVNVYFHRRMYK